jgi:hypothetical protein
MKDNLWSIDLFQGESAVLRTYWVLVVMDQFTRRIVGFGIHAGITNGLAVCRMFNSKTACNCLPSSGIQRIAFGPAPKGKAMELSIGSNDSAALSATTTATRRERRIL